MQGSEFTATEKSLRKKDASRLCAWKVCQQLLRKGLIEKFDPNAPSSRQLLKNNFIYEFLVSSSLKEQMMATCSLVHHYNTATNPPMEISNAQANRNSASSNLFASNLFWSPPEVGFNPWDKNVFIDPVLKNLSLEEINAYLKREFFQMISKTPYKEVLKTRSQLPIYLVKKEIIDLIANNSVVVIKGSSGCGKTTQVPQFILDSYLRNGQGAHCNIVVTQPRRISAVSISERVAFERCETLVAGRSSVGYSVRFEQISPRSYGSVLFCTSGDLLQRMMTGLHGISHLVIDEVHERDINTDLLLAIAKEIKSNGLKVIILSATENIPRLKQYFICKVYEVEGK